jgi:predicted ArsR family transcriptional regulator
MPTPDARTTHDSGSSLRLFATTRGKLLATLCRGPSTVTELAERLSVTDNAVRAQLERLSRDGLVRRAGSRRGVRRPHADYELTPRGRGLFPRGYEAVLVNLVDVLTDRLPARAVRTFFNEVGDRILREWVGEIRGANPRQRLRAILKKLGPFAAGLEVEEQPGKAVIRACSCPLKSVTTSHPELCVMVGGLVSKVLGADVLEACERGEWPQCRFEVSSLK